MWSSLLAQKLKLYNNKSKLSEQIINKIYETGNVFV